MTRSIIRSLLLLALAAASPTAMAQTAGLFPIVEQDRWGFMDATGKVVIAPHFRGVNSFHDGLAYVVDEDGSKGFIDASGKVVLRPAFDIVGDFSQGLAAVNIGEVRDPRIGLLQKTGTWGYIDTTGTLVLPLKFTKAGAFSEGLAAVHQDGRSGFIDRTGRMIFEAPFDITWGFHEDVVLVKSNLKMAYYDRTGQRLATPPLDDNYYGASFSEGLAAVKTADTWGYVDKTGKLVIPAEFREASSFHEGLAAVQSPSAPGPSRTCAMPSGSTYSLARSYGYIDKTGRMVIPPTAEYAADFSEGLARVSSCGQVSFIDKTGKTVLSVPYSEASSFSGGLAEVRVSDSGGTRRGYINRTGKVVRAPTK